MRSVQKCVSRVSQRLSARTAFSHQLPRSLAAASLPHRAGLVCVALTTQTRLCTSSAAGTTGGTPSTTAPSSPPPPQSLSRADESALSADEQAAADAIRARIQGLSPEDQALILNALQNPTAQKSSVMGGEGIGPAAAEMVAAFTCGRCDYRMVKRFSKHAYTKGIVIVECPNCHVKHLIADNLGWIEDEARTIEDILRERGESFVRIGNGDYQVVVDAQPEAKTE